jgi:ribonucleotide reductase beta subunit family protein with ferritin-like domain
LQTFRVSDILKVYKIILYYWSKLKLEDLLNPSLDRFMLFPIKHHDLHEFYKQGIAMFWTAEEIDLARDLEHWKNLTEGERHYLKFILAFFAASDTLVNENLVLNFYKEVQYPEAREYYALQMLMETIHSEVYGLLINTYIQNEKEKKELFNAIRTIPAVAEKAEYCFRWFDKEKDFASRLVAFSCVEGIFFSASFASIFFFKSKGVLPGLTVSNDYISRDEQCLLPSTEVLTPSGWVALQDLKQGVKVATWDPQTEHVVFSVPNAIIKKIFKGEMIKMHTKSNHAPYCLTMTPDHRMYYKMKHKNEMVCTLAANFSKGSNAEMPMGGYAQGKIKELSYKDRFRIALQADGTADLRAVKSLGSVSGCWAANFSFTKVIKKARFLDICNKLEWDVTYDPSLLDQHEKQVFRVKVPLTDLDAPLNGKQLGWVWPMLGDVSSEWAAEFIDELVKWDGSEMADAFLYSTTKKENVSVVQTVAALCGYRTSCSEIVDDRKETYSNCYKVYFTKNAYKDGLSLIKKYIPYDDTVMCLSVDSGAFMVRENGHISMTGNCHTTFALMLYQKLKFRLNESQIHEIYKEAVELEKRFVNDSLPTDLIGMNKKLMCQYVEFVADQQLRQFGYNPIYRVEQPFEFMRGQGLAVKANFFEGRVTAYAKEQGSSEVVFNADF